MNWILKLLLLLPKFFGFFKGGMTVDPLNPTAPTSPGSPQSDRLRVIVDEVLDALYEATSNSATIGGRALHYAIGVLDFALETLWPRIFPAVQAKLSAKGINVS